jgi:transposase
MAWRRGQALGQDLRDRVLADAGRPARAVAARFGVSVSYVVKARQRLRDASEASARPQRNRVPPRLAPHGEAIRTEVAARPSATVAELRAWLGSPRRMAPWSGTPRCGAPSAGSA